MIFLETRFRQRTWERDGYILVAECEEGLIEEKSVGQASLISCEVTICRELLNIGTLIGKTTQLGTLFPGLDAMGFVVRDNRALCTGEVRLDGHLIDFNAIVNGIPAVKVFIRDQYETVAQAIAAAKPGEYVLVLPTDDKPCPACGGSGKRLLFTSECDCDTCGGSGRI